MTASGRARALIAGGRSRRPARETGATGRGYRPALDGVRAVAVLAVIAYHVSDKKPSGGFLGVDVFFVLSGYLITSLLLEERAARGSIRLAGFWARRARRLLPAVLLLVAVCAVVVARIDPAATFAARRDDMLSTLAYVANWHFIASDQSYFALATDASPMRHMWSLAIEEQYYALWPLIVLVALAVDRGRHRVLLALAGVGAVLSAVRMAALFDPIDPSRSYYGTDTRVAALLIGGALAVLLSDRPSLVTGERARRAAVWIGPAMAIAVLVAFARAGEQSAFYYRGGAEVFALAVAGGLWAVESAPGGFPGALLSIAPVRWIGMISYGLYLWHWPIVVWLGPRLAVGDRERQVIEVTATFAVAAGSFYLVERPIRYGTVPVLRRSAPRLAVATIVGVALVGGLTVWATTGGTRLARQVLDSSDSACPAGSPTVGSTYQGAGLVPARWCSRTTPRRPDSSVVAVAGDSTSRALDPGMRALAKARGWRYIQAGIDGCSALVSEGPPGASPVLARQFRSCAEKVPRLLRQVEAAYHPDVWFISDLTGYSGNDSPSGAGSRATRLAAEVGATLRALTAGGSKVVLLAPPPTGQPVECAVKKPPPDACRDVQYTVASPITEFQDLVQYRGAARVHRGVAYVSVTDILCPRGRCPAELGGILARYDGVHYTGRFSRRIVPMIVARAERAGVRLTR